MKTRPVLAVMIFGLVMLSLGTGAALALGAGTRPIISFDTPQGIFLLAAEAGMFGLGLIFGALVVWGEEER